MTSYVTRIITRGQAEEWELAFHAPGELSREFIEERRWYSAWRVVFIAPDDGFVYSAEYMHPATEMQDIDPWDEAASVTLTHCRPQFKTVTEWVPVEEVCELADSTPSGPGQG